MQPFKVRASAAGRIMSASGKLIQGNYGYVEELVRTYLYGQGKEFSSKYTDKGITNEDQAIDLAIDWLNLPFAIKNEETFEDDYFTGTPDIILEDEVIDIKCSWDHFTFPLFDDALPNKDYFYQLQVYMHLTGKEKSRVVYMLMDYPYDYKDTPINLRHKSFSVDYDPEVIEFMQSRIDELRKYQKQLINKL